MTKALTPLEVRKADFSSTDMPSSVGSAMNLHVVLGCDARGLRDDVGVDALGGEEGRLQVDRHAVESRVGHELARSCNAHLTLDECGDGELGVALHVVLGCDARGLRDDEGVDALRGEVPRLLLN